MSGWNPGLYLQFGDERTQPACDLAARIELERPDRIIDLGCGPGNSTRILRERWPGAQIAGLDSSPEMIQTAREAYPQETWIRADIADWRPEGKFDVLFSSATLQWLPGHEELIPKLFAYVAARGAFAVQLPANNRSPLHTALLRVARKPAWAGATAGCDGMITYRDPGFYYDVLASLSRRVILWQTTYYHVMSDPQGLIEWYSSTGMKTYLARLADGAERKAFQRQVLEECRPEYPPQADGKILFPFRRFFFIVYKD
jgi:trans-aconitate 2-methyltransferase